MLDREILTLEEIGARTWPAQETIWLGGWLLSIDRGLTRRANSVLPLGWDDKETIGDRIDAVEHRYRERGLSPCFKMTRAACPPGLDDVLARRGYRSEGRSLVLTAEPAPSGEPDDTAIEMSSAMTPEWLQCTWPERGDDERWIGIVGRIADPKAHALARIDGQPAGGALAVIEGGWACVTAVHTLPAFRHRGVARRLVAALSRWARGQASALFLQVESDNEPALRLYNSAGFRISYEYHYRTLAP